ncbi:uncharacterized protein LOC143460592 isoform X2 [Clavelina lepadiformis]
MDKTRIWQIITAASCSIACLSLILNVVVLVMIGNLNKNTQDIVSEGAHVSEESSATIIRLKHNLEKQIDRLKKSVGANNEQQVSLQERLKQMRVTVNWAKTKLNQSWKKGCPQNGLTNGSLCYVLHRDKSNYTEALSKCMLEGGQLAPIPDRDTLPKVLEAFSQEPFYVDAHFDKTLEKWTTSTGKEVDFPTTDLEHKESQGQCLYAFRSGYKQWYCHASFFYLCLF